MRKLPVLLALLLAVIAAFGQQSTFLLLEKENKSKNAYYEVGDELTFYLADRRSRVKDKIIRFKDSTIVFRGYRVPVSRITALHIDDKTRWWLRYKPAQLLLIIGIGYVLIDAVNSREFAKETLAVGGSLIGLGLIFRLLIPNRIKIRGKTKLRIVTV